ncbi:MAG TPA: MBL fold metallo-hydrolase [Nannocystaceae bacterium]|nr:MBL fold metallo-hydrolase [Nannocystaceae bacterium]
MRAHPPFVIVLDERSALDVLLSLGFLRLRDTLAIAVLGLAGCREPTDLSSYPWHDGVDCSTAAPDVVQLSDDTFVFRQPLCANFEGPFLYLFLGRTNALLLDSGTAASNMAIPVLAKVDEYRAKHGLDAYELVVAHTHSHGDHVGGDRFFAERSDVTVVGRQQSEVARFFGLDRQTTGAGEARTWPNTSARFDLGERVLDVLPLPGHDAAHLLVYDAKERLLLTGDTLYPGRLYIDVWPEFRASTKRLAEFAATHDVRWVLGAHIELQRERNADGTASDYEMGAAVHANEHPLVLPPDEPAKLWTMVETMGETPRREASEHFIVYPVDR